MEDNNDNLNNNVAPTPETPPTPPTPEPEPEQPAVDAEAPTTEPAVEPTAEPVVESIAPTPEAPVGFAPTPTPAPVAPSTNSVLTPPVPSGGSNKALPIIILIVVILIVGAGVVLAIILTSGKDGGGSNGKVDEVVIVSGEEKGLEEEISADNPNVVTTNSPNGTKDITCTIDQTDEEAVGKYTLKLSFDKNKNPTKLLQVANYDYGSSNVITNANFEAQKAYMIDQFRNLMEIPDDVDIQATHPTLSSVEFTIATKYGGTSFSTMLAMDGISGTDYDSLKKSVEKSCVYSGGTFDAFRKNSDSLMGTE